MPRRNPDEFKVVRDQVKHLYQRHPWIFRYGDSALTYIFWRKIDAPRIEQELGIRVYLPKLPVKVLTRLTNPETIIRRRRELGIKYEEYDVYEGELIII